MNQTLKMDVMAQWIEAEWIPNHPEQEWMTLWIPNSCIDQTVLAKLNPTFELEGGYAFAGFEETPCPVLTRINNYSIDGDVTHRTGAFIYTFKMLEGDETVKVLVTSAYYTDDGYMVCLTSIPVTFFEAWNDFTNECNRLARALSPDSKVVIIGGAAASFVPTVEWDEVILPHKLKDDILEDVQSFFTKGIEVYKRLNLKPFRKLLLAGVPGTGKTMLCSALAKWSLDRDYLVIYISSADRNGSTFGKIQHALSVASYSSHPTLILLEELDAYLHEEEKALVLNVLDGSESSINDKGTLLISTTNYPEAIDERVLKRPGRLDRIFIIPETRDTTDAEKMLRQYLGAMWQDDHSTIVKHLVGYPGAFIREVAVYALTQVAYDDLADLPLELLEKSFKGLKDQIDARDDFLKRTTRAAEQPLYTNGLMPGINNGKHNR